MCKLEILQSYSNDEPDHTQELSVEYLITSDDLISGEITRKTGIAPERCWQKGQKWYAERISKETGEVLKYELTRVNGIWVISSEKKLKSLYVNDHIELA